MTDQQDETVQLLGGNSGGSDKQELHDQQRQCNTVAIQTVRQRSADPYDPMNVANPAMDLMFKELEATMMESLKGVEELNREIRADREKQERDKETMFVPQKMKGDGSEAGKTAMVELHSHLLSKLTLPATAGPAGSAFATAAWLSTCGLGDSASSLAWRARSDAIAWLGDLTGLTGGRFRLHFGDAWDGARLACRAALSRAYPDSAVGGQHQLMMQRPPVVYLHPSCPPTMAEAMALQLCLPRASVRRLPGEVGDGHRLTADTLTAAIDADASQTGGRPLFAASVCGSDSLSDLLAACRGRPGVWLHAHGAQLADALLLTCPTASEGGAYPDSIGLDFGQMLGLPGLPLATWISGEAEEVVDEEEFEASLTSWLPVWLGLQRLGRGSALRRAARVRECRAEFARIVVERRPRLRLVAGDPTDVLFRYADDVASEEVWLNPETLWLVESLTQADGVGGGGAFQLSAVSLSAGQRRQVVGRYRPLECPTLPAAADFERLLRVLDEGLQLLGATRRLRPEFQRRVAEEPQLTLVPLPDWPGLGAVRFAGGAADTDAVNRALFAAISQEDSGFSWHPAASGASSPASGVGCLRFGLVPAGTDLSALLTFVLELGAQCDARQAADEAVVSSLRRGIAVVERGIAEDERSRLELEGVLRQVPFVDVLVNWMSPLPPRRRLAGSAMSLRTGQLSSTELTYQYKMQFGPAE